MVVDDEPVNVKLVDVALRRAGMKVVGVGVSVGVSGSERERERARERARERYEAIL